MKPQYFKLCIFEFNNGTFLRTLIPYIEDQLFEAALITAKQNCWSGNENNGRGGMKSFTIGELVIINQ